MIASPATQVPDEVVNGVENFASLIPPTANFVKARYYFSCERDRVKKSASAFLSLGPHAISESFRLEGAVFFFGLAVQNSWQVVLEWPRWWSGVHRLLWSGWSDL